MVPMNCEASDKSDSTVQYNLCFKNCTGVNIHFNRPRDGNLSDVIILEGECVDLSTAESEAPPQEQACEVAAHIRPRRKRAKQKKSSGASASSYTTPSPSRKEDCDTSELLSARTSDHPSNCEEARTVPTGDSQSKESSLTRVKLDAYRVGPLSDLRRSSESIATDALMSECESLHQNLGPIDTNSTSAHSAVEALSSDNHRLVAIVPPNIRLESRSSAESSSTPARDQQRDAPGIPLSSSGRDDNSIPSEIVYFHQLQRYQLQQSQRIEQELLDLDQQMELERFSTPSSNSNLRTGLSSSSSTMDTDILLQPQSSTPSLQTGRNQQRYVSSHSNESVPNGQQVRSQSNLRSETQVPGNLRCESTRRLGSRNLVTPSSTGGQFRRTRSAPRSKQHFL